MAKPYRVRNLLGLFTLVVLGFSGLFTSLFFIVLRAVKILPPAFFATVWMPLIIVAVANLFAAGVNYIFVPKVIRPLESMIEATKKIGSGDFSVRVPSEHLDGEMKELADSLNTMTEELGNTEIFRSDFIRDFSHEFKTPIVSMKGFARQLKNRDLSEAEREQYCDIIISEADRLTEMSQNILTLSRFENQQIVTDKEPFRLDEQIRDCVLILEKEWEKKSLNLELELSPIVLEQNKGMLQHVWINLVGNAVNFTDPEGKIRIEATENESTAFVTVRDSGIGMTEEEMKRIFDKCYQADRSRSGKGNGLGLCIVKRICTLCGGSVTVRSKLGKGSVFTVILPKS